MSSLYNKTKPLAIDLYAGLGGWAEGLLAEGWDVIGFDIERHDYGAGAYPGQLVLQDILTLHGAQLRNADLIVASPPCQEYSYMAMPWQRGKQIARALRGEDKFPEPYTGSRTVEQLTALFDACFRIQREAVQAAGHHIPLIVENVKGAQPWVGRSRFAYGSFHLWGDVPVLMPGTMSDGRKVPGMNFHDHEKTGKPGRSFQSAAVKVSSEDGGRRTDRGKGARFTSRDCGVEGTKNGKDWFGAGENCSLQRCAASGTTARKAASAQIAKIPLPLAQHIARVYHGGHLSGT